MTRKATPEDIDEICRSLPESELGTSWGDVPTWKVPVGEKGKGFLLYRHPHKSAIDPETGEMYDDLLVIMTPTEVEKQPWSRPRRRSSPSTTSAASTRCWCSNPGWASWTATSWREVITDAWAGQGAQAAGREHLGDG